MNVEGMTLEEATTAVREAAVKAMTATATGVYTVVGKANVLVGIARPGRHALTFLIPRKDYNGLQLLALIEEHGYGSGQ